LNKVTLSFLGELDAVMEKHRLLNFLIFIENMNMYICLSLFSLTWNCQIAESKYEHVKHILAIRYIENYPEWCQASYLIHCNEWQL